MKWWFVVEMKPTPDSPSMEICRCERAEIAANVMHALMRAWIDSDSAGTATVRMVGEVRPPS